MLKKSGIILLLFAYVFQFGILSCLLELSQQIVKMEKMQLLKSDSNIQSTYFFSKMEFSAMVLSAHELRYQGHLYDYRLIESKSSAVRIQMNQDREEEYIIQLAEKINERTNEDFKSIAIQFIGIVQYIPPEDNVHIGYLSFTETSYTFHVDYLQKKPFLYVLAEPPDGLLVS